MRLNEINRAYNYQGWEIINPIKVIALADYVRPPEFFFKDKTINRGRGMHITWKFGTPPSPVLVSQMQKEIFGIEDIMAEGEAIIVEYACNENIEAFRVELNGKTHQQNGIKPFHITVSFNNDTLSTDERGKTSPTKPMHSWLLFSVNSTAIFSKRLKETVAIKPLI